MIDWKDPTLVGHSVDDIQLRNVFNPEISIENAVEDDQPIKGSTFFPRMHEKSIEQGVCVDGHLKKTSRYRMTLMCDNLDLRTFPFDTQILPIRLKSRRPDVALVGPEGFEGSDESEGLRKMGHAIDDHADHLSEWRIHSLMGIRASPQNRFYEIHIVVTRDPDHVLWNVGFPVMIIWLFSFNAYFIPMAEINGRLEITATCLLGMMAFQGSIKDMLPPMPYLTAMGKYIVAVFLMLVAHGAQHAMAYLWTSGTSSNAWRSQPPDVFFEKIRYWDDASKDPVVAEAVWVALEFIGMIIFHVILLWRNYRTRRQGALRRSKEALQDGICLIDGPPEWDGRRHIGLREISRRSRSSTNTPTGFETHLHEKDAPM